MAAKKKSKKRATKKRATKKRASKKVGKKAGKKEVAAFMKKHGAAIRAFAKKKASKKKASKKRSSAKVRKAVARATKCSSAGRMLRYCAMKGDVIIVKDKGGKTRRLTNKELGI